MLKMNFFTLFLFYCIVTTTLFGQHSFNPIDSIVLPKTVSLWDSISTNPFDSNVLTLRQGKLWFFFTRDSYNGKIQIVDNGNKIKQTLHIPKYFSIKAIVKAEYLYVYLGTRNADMIIRYKILSDTVVEDGRAKSKIEYSNTSLYDNLLGADKFYFWDMNTRSFTSILDPRLGIPNPRLTIQELSSKFHLNSRKSTIKIDKFYVSKKDSSLFHLFIHGLHVIDDKLVTVYNAATPNITLLNRKSGKIVRSFGTYGDISKHTQHLPFRPSWQSAWIQYATNPIFMDAYYDKYSSTLYRRVLVGVDSSFAKQLNSLIYEKDQRGIYCARKLTNAQDSVVNFTWRKSHQIFQVYSLTGEHIRTIRFPFQAKIICSDDKYFWLLNTNSLITNRVVVYKFNRSDFE
jgi:hypothetical protein